MNCGHRVPASKLPTIQPKPAKPATHITFIGPSRARFSLPRNGRKDVAAPFEAGPPIRHPTPFPSQRVDPSAGNHLLRATFPFKPKPKPVTLPSTSTLNPKSSNSTTHDLAIVGGGFAGAILAQIARQLGRSVLLVERDRHPRFAIGESSTPIANLILEELSDRYRLPALKPLSKWGTWQATYPDIGCGLKRGFSFYHHSAGSPWHSTPGRERELLVAANPSDPIADTHWYRPDFDAFLFAEAARLGTDVHESTQLDPPEFTGDVIHLRGRNPDGPFHATARLLIDASGPRGYLHRSLGLAEATPDAHRHTESVFSHFRHVPLWADLHPPSGTPPFPPDAAALHHVWDAGWMWVLRFNNGLTSAGFARRRESRPPTSPAKLWREHLERFPSIAEAFVGSEPVRPFTHLPQLSFRSSRAAGPRWAMLPIAAGFVDPLLSTGFPLSLLGIERIARLLESDATPDFTAYGEAVLADLDITFDLIAALYRAMPDFDTFRELTMLYFTAAIYTETARRLGRPSMAPGFLMRDHSTFGPTLRQCLAQAGKEPGAATRDKIRTLIEPFNLAGLCSPAKHHWYGCEASDLYAAAHRIQATPDDITQLLRRAGFDNG
jgi:FADH2 O2-dependent halogenase